MNIQSTYLLNDGTRIPTIGFGTYKLTNDVETEEIIAYALNNGYRHIDTAAVYGNEEAVGQGMKKSGLSREDIYLTTKLDNPNHSYELARSAIDESLERLGTDYIDLYLVHWPNPKEFRPHWQEANAASWEAMEEAVAAGKIRTLGVSNFMPHHLDELFKTAKIKPAVNQILLNPSDLQENVVAYNDRHQILSEAYSPLGTGKIFEIDHLKHLADKYHKTVAQVVIRWSLQHGFLPLPKTQTRSRIKENIDVFDFELLPEDMKTIDQLRGQAGLARDPDQVDF